MALIAIDQPKGGRFEFLNNGMLDYFLPEICAISELQEMDTDFSKTGLCYVFKMYLAHCANVEFGFETEQEGRALRQDLIACLSNYWGPEKMIFADGYDFEVTIVPAVRSVTEVYNKDARSSFSIVVDSVPYPINMIFTDELTAKAHHRNLLDAIEIHRCQRSRDYSKIMIYD